MTAPRNGQALLGIAAVLAALAAAPDASAQRLGRLFTAPEERVRLDELRYQAQIVQPVREPEPAPAAASDTPPEPAGPTISNLTVNGVVRRSGGRGTVWVNGDEVERGGMTREGIEVQSAGPGGGGVRVRLPSGVESIELKPGQKVDVINGVVLEPYEKGARPSGPSVFEAPPATGTDDPAPSPAAAAPADRAAAPGAVPQPVAGPAAQDLLERLRQISALPPQEQARMLQGLEPAKAPPAPATGDAPSAR